MAVSKYMQFWGVPGYCYQRLIFVCGLMDTKCQKELLCMADLTVAATFQKGRSVEVVT